MSALILKAKFTANARNIAAVIAICLGSYGITMLTWLDQNQQKEVQLQPRDTAPDFLVTEARYLNYRPLKSDERQSNGFLHIDIKSKTLAHFADQKKTIFEQPTVELIDPSGANWLVTAATAHAKATDESSDVITLEGKVTLTALDQQAIAMRSDFIEIQPSKETIKSNQTVSIDFPGGQLTAGSFASNMNSGRVLLSEGVKAQYFPPSE